MPNPFAVTRRAQEIIAERFARWHEDLQQHAQEAHDAPQREKRAAYDQVRELGMADYPAARAAFDEEFGLDAWQRQSALGLRRQEKQGE